MLNKAFWISTGLNTTNWFVHAVSMGTLISWHLQNISSYIGALSVRWDSASSSEKNLTKSSRRLRLSFLSRFLTALRLSVQPVCLYTFTMWRAVVYLIPRSNAMRRTDYRLENARRSSSYRRASGTYEYPRLAGATSGAAKFIDAGCSTFVSSFLV